MFERVALRPKATAQPPRPSVLASRGWGSDEQHGDVVPEAHAPGWSFASIPIQPKLEVGAPDDEYEREADRIAEHVMRMPEPEERMKDEGGRRNGAAEAPVRLQAGATGPAGVAVTPETEVQIQSTRGGGRPLSESERAFFEPRFGYDFSKVRIHDDSGKKRGHIQCL
jgi:hypothetical protein